ncbi:MAG TPA: phosphate uptake regulator PhoU, partial [Nitrososphaerales archaeon]|nr:phosphate uptake regulator PhoU [Nitrososphaerales archaeon]
MDIGLERLNSLLLDMATLSQQAVSASIDAYSLGSKGTEVRQMSNRLHALHRQVSDLSIEMIARYQPVASDLRFLRACMEISYGFFRYGRYALDITSVLEMFGDLSKCDKQFVVDTAQKTQEMIRMSVEAFSKRDLEMARNIPKMDDVVDEAYRNNLRKTLEKKGGDTRCALSSALILRYLERIADHASYIGESVEYI